MVLQVVDDSGMVYTVALCTHNQAQRLRRTLEDLAAVKDPSAPWELLIVDNASSDETASLIAANYWRKPEWNIRTVYEEKLGLSYARNRAIEDAHGEYIIFMDDDETPDADWLIAYESAIEQHHPDALGGRIEVLFEDGERPPWLQDELLGFLGKLDHGEKPFWLEDSNRLIFGGNFSFRREIFKKTGLFDCDLGRRGRKNTGGEDTQMCRRLLTLGCRVRWVPDAVIYHRIQSGKLKRRYFVDLHYRMGFSQGTSKRGCSRRIPPAYIVPQLWRACMSALRQRFKHGGDMSLRKEMNVGYFMGFIMGWLCGRIDTDSGPAGGIS